MRLHYLNEPVKYIADVKPEDRDNYIFTWYFDEKDPIVGAEVSHAWNDVGDHTIKLVTYDKKTGLSGYKFTTVNVVLRNVKHPNDNSCYMVLTVSLYQNHYYA